MTFASTFSGGGCADLGLIQAGLKPLWFSEIDPHASAVLKYHHPDIPNHGDVTKIDGNAVEVPDVFWMSPPCQDLSICGKRAGLKGERSGLFYGSIRLVSEMKPEWVVMEQVPGLLSSNGGDDFISVLDSMDELGYVLDCDIIDSQFMGVAQRRKRIYFVWQQVNHIRNKQTRTSALTILQTLSEILRMSLADRLAASTNAQENLGYVDSSVTGGLSKRMKLFDLPSENQAWSNLLEFWEGRCQQYPTDAKNLASGTGRKSQGEPMISTGTLSDKENGNADRTVEPSSCLNTGQSWKSILDEICDAAKSYTTSMQTRTITESKIFSCAMIAERIVLLICQLSDCSQTCFSAASSALTILEEFTNYAKQATSSLFGEMEWIQSWSDFADRAAALCVIARNLDVRSWGEILSLAEGLSGSPEPRREKEHKVATTVGIGPPFSRTGNDRVEADALVSCYSAQSFGDVRQSSIAGTVQTNGDNDERNTPALVAKQYAVRRLCPTECERLQGLPDEWTKFGTNEKGTYELPDSARYRIIGNGVTATVAKWIGERINEPV